MSTGCWWSFSHRRKWTWFVLFLLISLQLVPKETQFAKKTTKELVWGFFCFLGGGNNWPKAVLDDTRFRECLCTAACSLHLHMVSWRTGSERGKRWEWKMCTYVFFQPSQWVGLFELHCLHSRQRTLIFWDFLIKIFQWTSQSLHTENRRCSDVRDCWCQEI